MRLTSLVILSHLCAALCFGQPNLPENGIVYTAVEIPKVYITIDADSLEELYLEENWYSNHEYPVQFVFESSTQQDTIENVGFRFRGNTSRDKFKKSFKVSFNTFEPGQKYFGLEKLNLNAEVNDPAMIRSRLCWDLFRTLNVPAPQSNHVQVFINGEYFGLYQNTEHIDEEFCDLRFGNQNGNLYKCRYPANLSFLGNDPDNYKIAPWGPRTYELKTNPEEDNYSDLAEFIEFLNFADDSELECEINKYFNVYSYLKVAAIDVLTGNWDGYIYNQNNFYLYHNPLSNQFEYIPYDLDNTWGIDWLDRNWSNRNIYTWSQTGQQRPLFNRLVNVDSFRDIFSFHVNDLLENHFNTEEHQESIISLQEFIEDLALADNYRPLDWGFDNQDFLNSLEENAGGHVDFGIFDFADIRSNSASSQLEPHAIAPISSFIKESFQNFPNSFEVQILLEGPFCQFSQLNYTIDGITQTSQTVSNPDSLLTFQIALPDNFDVLSYNVHLISLNGNERDIYCEPRDIFNSNNDAIVLNEVMSSNDVTISDEFEEFDDWVEIYNKSAEEINLGGYFLSDDLNAATKWSFPDYLIQPGEHLLVWCDRNLHQGEFHSNFRLSSSGEQIGIFKKEPNGIRWVDAIEIPAIPSDFSYGREDDAQNPWILFSNPTPGATNNNSLSVHNYEKSKLTVYPNPTNSILFFNEVHHFFIISTDGRILHEGTGISFNTEALHNGLYLLQFEDSVHSFVKN